MNPAFLQNEFVVALCWTLIHSIWQGMILATITGAVLLATKRSHAGKRYLLLTTLFFLFMTATVITFLRELQLAAPADLSPLLPETIARQALTAQVVVGQAGTGIEATTSFWEKCTAYFNTHASTVVLLWLVIFLARLVKLIADLVTVQRLRSYRVVTAGTEWNEKLLALITKLGIRKQVKLLQSGIVKVPVTMGVFKPVILLPLGLLNHLPPAEIEAILLHELAHIRRSDYFINLLQSLAETIFFFNPALLWLSSMMREERENCCDDIAISVTNSKTQFINALIAFQEYHYAQPAMGLAFPGSKHQLLNRVKRIVHNRNKTLNAAEKSILSLGVALFIMFSFVAAKKIPQNIAGQVVEAKQSADKLLTRPAVTAKAAARLKIKADTAIRSASPKMSADVVIRDSVQEVPLVVERSADLAPLARLQPLQGKLVEIRDTLPASNYSHFSTTINDDGKTRVVDMTATSKDGKEYRFKKVNGELKELFVNGKQVAEADYKNYQDEINEIELIHQYKMEQGRKQRELARVQRDIAEETRRRLVERKTQQLKETRQLELLKRQQESELRRQSMEEKQRVQKEHLLRDKERLMMRDSGRVTKLDPKIVEKKVQESLESLNNDWAKEMTKHYLDRRRVDSLHREKLRIRRDTALHHEYANRVQLHFKKQLDIQNKLELREHRLKSDSSVQLKLQKLHVDSIKLKMRPDHSMALNKLESLRAQFAEDAARVKVSADVMKNILSDLAAENINVNRQNGWFALDNDKFVVDGQPLPGNLHQKFKAKYLKPGGWGYYYGPVKVTGRGIFLDNKDVPVR